MMIILCTSVERLYVVWMYYLRSCVFMFDDDNFMCCLDVLLRSCVFVFDDDNFMCDSVEQNLVCVFFMCVDIMSNFVLKMIILCLFCFL
ncbi:hypothetical protein HanRHA438_Chr17g0818441 [Helianthus annuus]|uniref:Uncharacterized protein n=1 Tax=Helianthus annuus TaxID=4232 RepID=A0A9K3DKN6_HELAN|nr:hypothetical protein HanXRQr2_Chr17g0808701 [Helianthus annuus]KAJ0429561.1 hypothetical protein HanHA300_Chr17g0658761 [Helianthus annuus]KAJ0447947.1 hypothetical protein HanHA89_Chr17g0711141 [Helianthus annuus]KAJ0632842.1 hypothetical protein HanLR1_Chr17g0669721 [Helianthus annuus]KAJ0826805.1 hypothetical protein HanRHA438_Chr17g0818441 [Helianthus annuus]